MNTQPLTGKRAIVTGASRGIGKAIAVALAEAGADVALLARSETDLNAVAADIKDLDRRAFPIVCDVTDPDQIDRAVDAAVDGLGGLDIAVNNAGGFSWSGPFLDLTPTDWERTRTLNLDSAVWFLRRVGAVLTEQGSGSVLNVSSIAGTGGAPRLSHYALCKAGLISLTHTLAVEWAAKGVRVNAIAPGWVETKLTRGFTDSDDIRLGLEAEMPLHSWARPEDVTEAAVYLCGDGARIVTGSVLILDGGLTSQLSRFARDLLDYGRAPA